MVVVVVGREGDAVVCIFGICNIGCDAPRAFLLYVAPKPKVAAAKLHW
jgi:hypothetical protein